MSLLILLLQTDNPAKELRSTAILISTSFSTHDLHGHVPESRGLRHVLLLASGSHVNFMRINSYDPQRSLFQHLLVLMTSMNMSKNHVDWGKHSLVELEIVYIL